MDQIACKGFAGARDEQQLNRRDTGAITIYTLKPDSELYFRSIMNMHRPGSAAAIKKELNSETEAASPRVGQWLTASAQESDSDLGPSGGFSHSRFMQTDFVTIERLSRGDSAIADELFRVIEFLNGRPVGSFANVQHLYATLGKRAASTLSSRSIELLRDLFVDRVNKRLQREVYQRHFRTSPPPTQANHSQKLAALEATRGDAQAIVDGYDWDWLAEWLQLKLIGEDARSCIRRLSNFGFPVRRINFRFTYHCNIACRHCYNSSGPHLKAQSISLDWMLAVVAQMPDVGIPFLNLTGGEPFLYPDHLSALIAAGRAAGLRGISIYTNGYWATTNNRTEQVLERLSAAGFMLEPEDYIKVSTGLYHQEFIAFDHVLKLARCYYAMFGRRLRVDFEKGAGSTDITDWVRQVVCNAGIADQIDLFVRSVSPLGRGKDLNGFSLHSIDSPCNAIDQIVFDPDGSVRPCCGFNNENQGVVIGQLKTHNLMDLVKRMQNDPVLQFLARNPMSAICDHLAKVPKVSGYSGACHFCQDTLGDLIDKEPLQSKLFEKQEFFPFWFTLSGKKGAAGLIANGNIVAAQEE